MKYNLAQQPPFVAKETKTMGNYNDMLVSDKN